MNQNVDCWGTPRGACTDSLCACTQFVSSEDVMNCAECNHSAGTHQNLGAALASSDDTPKPQNEEQQPSNSWFWRSISTLCTAESSWFFNYYPPHATSGAQLCRLPGCTNPRSVDPSTGKLYEYCGKAHYLEHQRSLAVGVPAHLRCKTPNCPRQRNPIPDGSGYYDYCCITCRDSGATSQPSLIHGTQQLPPDQLCSLPGCTNPRNVDPSTGKQYEHCGKVHYLEHQRSLAVRVPAHLRCKTPNCPRQRNPIPDGSGYYDYCSITCRDNVPAHLRCKTPNCPRQRNPIPDGSGYYDYCSITCRDNVPHLRCKTPNCPRQRNPIPFGSGYYDYCSITCRDNAPVTTVPAHLQCKTPNCPRQRNPIPDGSGYYDYCSITCRDNVPAHLRCKTPNCPRQRNPIPDGSGYYDYCSITCRDSGSRAVTRPMGRRIVGRKIVRCRLLRVSASSAEYQTICSKFRQDWAPQKGPCPGVDFVLEVDCLALKRRWEDFSTALATRGSPTTVEEHYHGTVIKCDLAGIKNLCSHGDCGICGISRGGFKKQFIGTNIPKYKRFGDGFYLAPHSSKCHDYTRGSHTHRAMLLCDVLPGKKHVVTTDQTQLTAPPQGYDSVYGQPAPGCLNYPEIVLYDEASILPRYVIAYQKDGVGKIAK